MVVVKAAAAIVTPIGNPEHAIHRTYRTSLSPIAGPKGEKSVAIMPPAGHR